MIKLTKIKYLITGSGARQSLDKRIEEAVWVNPSAIISMIEFHADGFRNLDDWETLTTITTVVANINVSESAEQIINMIKEAV